MSNAFLIMGLTRRVSQFNEDRKDNVVSVATLDNIREICFLVPQIFDISIDTKDNLNDICHNCLVASEHLNTEMNEKTMYKRIHTIRIDLIRVLRTEKINIF